VGQLLGDLLAEVPREDHDVVGRTSSRYGVSKIGMCVPGRNFPCLNVLRSTVKEIRSCRMPAWFNSVFPLPGAPYAATVAPSRDRSTRNCTRSFLAVATAWANPS
jgi:hypothetical protein